MANTNPSTEGLPAVAATQRHALLIKVGIAVLCLLVVGYLFSGKFFSHAKTSAKALEEEYTLPPTPLPLSQKNLQALTLKTEQAQALAAMPNEQQAALASAYQGELQKRLAAPLFVINAETSDRAENNFVAATTLGGAQHIIAPGTVIDAVLETAVHSDLPGHARAVVSRPVYAEDGSQVLVPAGSRLVGQYQSALSLGQTRLFVVWQELITATGLRVPLDAPSADPIGKTGINADQLNTHFWQRFGSAALLSILGAGATQLGKENEGASLAGAAYPLAMAHSFNQAANGSLKNTANLAPTLQIDQGKAIKVFVNKTLVFPV